MKNLHAISKEKRYPDYVLVFKEQLGWSEKQAVKWWKDWMQVSERLRRAQLT